MLPDMMGRLAFAVALGLWLAFACSPGFTCSDDDQCSLSGEPGVCVAGGHCAYPDADCPSGLAFPKGAADDRAGQCVPGEGGSGSDSGSGSGSGSGDPGSTGPDPSSGDTGQPPLDGTQDSGGPECLDAYEPNDSQTESALLLFEAERPCLTSWEATLTDSLDEDWFQLDNRAGLCPTAGELTLTTDPPLDLCIVPTCFDEAVAIVLECDAELVPGRTGDACCGPGAVRIMAACPVGDPIMILSISATADTMECLPYQGATYP